VSIRTYEYAKTRKEKNFLFVGTCSFSGRAVRFTRKDETIGNYVGLEVCWNRKEDRKGEKSTTQ
jgi:hypothetical protein